MAKKVIQAVDEKIPSINQSWDIDETHSYKGSRVEEFLKEELRSKIGYSCYSPTVDGNNYYHRWGFYSKDDYTEYMADPEG